MPPPIETPSARAALRMDLGLFALATAVLTLEVLQTRIFVFTLDALTLHVAVGICLLGLGASGTLLALLPPAAPERASRLAGAAALLGAVTVLASHAAFARLSPGYFAGGPTGLLTTVALAVPYFFLGAATALLLIARRAAVGRAYAFNLAGSGLGCLIVFPALHLLGAESTLVLVAAIAGAAALVIAAPGGLGFRLAVGAVALVLLFVQVSVTSVFAFEPSRVNQMDALLRTVERLNRENPGAPFSMTPLFARWDRTGRIDVWDLRVPGRKVAPGRVDKPMQSLAWMQDGGAGSYLLAAANPDDRLAEFFERSVYGAGYVLGDPEDVLLIGLGGGPDIQTALHHGATRVKAVDINGTALEVIRDHFGAYLGDPAGRPGVTLHQMDGRAFVRSSDESFDLIQMSGVDTKTLIAAGALSLSENYLYTRQALREYLEHLRPDGRLAMLRPRGFETDRLVSGVLAALGDMGVASPERHVFAAGQGVWSCVLVQRSPFTPAQLDVLHDWVADAPRRASASPCSS